MVNAKSLPRDLQGLEILFNHYSSQLQGLASRINTLNEFMDMDRIVLGRMRPDPYLDDTDVREMELRFLQVKKAKNALKASVNWHRENLSHVRKALEALRSTVSLESAEYDAHGEKWSKTTSGGHIPTAEQWNELFAD